MNASAPTSCFFAQVNLRLIPEFDPLLGERFVDVDAGGRGRRDAEFEALDDFDDRHGLERFLECRQHGEIVLQTD